MNILCETPDCTAALPVTADTRVGDALRAGWALAYHGPGHGWCGWCSIHSPPGGTVNEGADAVALEAGALLSPPPFVGSLVTGKAA